MQNTANNQTGGIATAKPLTISSPGISFATSRWLRPQSCTAPPQVPSYSADVNGWIKLQNAEPGLTRNAAQPPPPHAHADDTVTQTLNLFDRMETFIDAATALTNAMDKELRILRREHTWSMLIEHQLKALGNERARGKPGDDSAVGSAYSALIRATVVRRLRGDKCFPVLSDHKSGSLYPIIRKVYVLGPIGILRVAVIDGIVWVSLCDAGRVTRISEDELRRLMHHKTAISGVFDLNRAGIDDQGIPLVGLYLVAEHARAFDSRFFHMLEDAGIDILNEAHAEAHSRVDSSSTAVVNLWGKANIA